MTDVSPQTISLDLEDLRDLYFYLGQVAAVATDRRDALKPKIIALMGDKTEMVTPDGWIFKIQERVTREYDKTQLRLVFDTDQLDVIMKPDNKAVEKLAKELKLPPEKLGFLEAGKKIISTSKALKLDPPNKETMSAIRS